MSMVLLKKQDVDKAKQIERQQEIEQGKTLAKKVDRLRETLADEEQSLTQYRNRTIQAIQGEIDAKIAEKDALAGEIRDRKLELARLMQPLDAKWADVKRAQAIVSKREDTSAAREAKNDIDYRINLVEAQQNDKKARELAAKEKSISSSAVQSGKIREEADRMLASTRSIAKQREQILAKREQELNAKEHWLDLKEIDLTNLQNNLQITLTAKENDLSNREIALTDKYLTLQRTVQRIKNHG